VRKNNVPTLADFKAGNVTDEERRELTAQIKNCMKYFHEASKRVHEEIIIASRPFLDWQERNRVHLNAYFELLRILEAAKNNPKIKRSSKISKMVGSLLEMFNDVELTKYDQINSVLDPVAQEGGKQALHQLRADGAAGTNEKYITAYKFCIAKAAEIWEEDNTIRMGEMTAKLEGLLCLEKMTAPTQNTIKKYLIKGEERGELKIPKSARKPGAPRKNY
jgi:hypothetical protein